MFVGSNIMGLGQSAQVTATSVSEGRNIKSKEWERPIKLKFKDHIIDFIIDFKLNWKTVQENTTTCFKRNNKNQSEMCLKCKLPFEIRDMICDITVKCLDIPKNKKTVFNKKKVTLIGNKTNELKSIINSHWDNIQKENLRFEIKINCLVLLKTQGQMSN